MVLGNRDEYPAYKFPMQLVEVICRKDIGEDLGDDAPELDEIKDPDAILYDCKFYLCKFNEEEDMLDWAGASTEIFKKSFSPEPGTSRRSYHGLLSQSQLLFAPGELKMTTQKKINKRCKAAVKKVFAACAQD